MGKNLATVLYVVLMVAVIVGVDFAFLRNHFWQRLITNVAIVFAFAAFYWVFLKRLIGA